MSLPGDLDFFGFSVFVLAGLFALAFLGEGDFAFFAGVLDFAGVFLAFETDFLAADLAGVLPRDFAGVLAGVLLFLAGVLARDFAGDFAGVLPRDFVAVF